MPVTVTMPRLSDTMEQGTIVKWNVKEGQKVASGDVVADIETDKATMELQSFDSGTVARLAVTEGQKVPVGTTILIIATPGEDVAAVAKGGGAAAAPAKKAEGAGSGGATASAASTAVADRAAGAHAAGAGGFGDHGPGANGAGSRVFASPLARKIAAERGVDLGAVHGSGPSGRIVVRDVEQAAAGDPQRAAGAITAGGGAGAAARPSSMSAPLPAPLPTSGARLAGRTVPLTTMRGVIAKRLVESKTTIPHYQVTVSARLDALMELREQLNAQLETQGVKLSVNDFLVRACGLAMHQHPFVNSSWVEKGGSGGPEIRIHERVNVGVAVSLPEDRGGGLVVATIYDADQHGLRHISAETKRLAKKAREKGLTPDEMGNSTFTISNLGMFGVDHFTAIINPPNAAILAVGRAIERPFVGRDDKGEPVLEIGHEMSMTLSSDHRIIDGAMAAQYLGTVKGMLESPASLLV
jgi:pyruvate dehydrogenase E2 component (dihydrolipoamide acetyltransferase)